MRFVTLAVVSVLGAACTNDSPGDDGMGSGSGSDIDDLLPPARGFQIETPEITIQPGEEITYCYYFKTPNTEAYTIKRWQSVMTGGSHHLIMFFTPQLEMPEGTVSASECSILAGGFTNLPSWIYSAQDVTRDLQLPADDGTGTPVGMDVPANQPAFVQLHYVNRGDDPLVVKAKINGEAYDAGVMTTKTYAYVTYNANIELDPMTNDQMVSLMCNIPTTSKIWLMTTHAHQLAKRTRVLDGSDVMFESDDWEHPGARAWTTAPFYQFSTGKLTTECTYDNPTGQTIYDGESAKTEEMCMASGYYFPATKATTCFNGFTI